jgi:CheY-like chemotaxis protein
MIRPTPVLQQAKLRLRFTFSVFCMTIPRKKIVAVLSDLMFTVKIQDAAKRADLDIVFVKTMENALAQAQQQPAAFLLDLNDAGARTLELIASLKSNPETNGIKLIGFVSHVQADVIQAAREKGCDTVMARSAFSQNLTAILQSLND